MEVLRVGEFIDKLEKSNDIDEYSRILVRFKRDEDLNYKDLVSVDLRDIKIKNGTVIIDISDK